VRSAATIRATRSSIVHGQSEKGSATAGMVAVDYLAVLEVTACLLF
jgi:hypothetical protein